MQCIDVLDPDAFYKCPRFGVKHPCPSWDSRRASAASLSLLRSSFLQTATNPHWHNLCISIVILDDEGMILQNNGTHVVNDFYLKNKQKNKWQCKNWVLKILWVESNLNCNFKTNLLNYILSLHSWETNHLDIQTTTFTWTLLFLFLETVVGNYIFHFHIKIILKSNLHSNICIQSLLWH